MNHNRDRTEYLKLRLLTDRRNEHEDGKTLKPDMRGFGDVDPLRGSSDALKESGIS